MSKDPDPVALQSSVQAIKGVGPVRRRTLEKAGFRSLRDLVLHLPTRYEDRREILSTAEVGQEGPISLRGTLCDLKRIFTRRRGFTIVRGVLRDGEGAIPVIWFNRPYLLSQVEEKTEYILHGTVRRRDEDWELVNPSVEAGNRSRLAGSIVPVYPAAGKISSNQFRALVWSALDLLMEQQIDDPLPANLRRRHSLPELIEALCEVHRPVAESGAPVPALSTCAAHGRLVYEEALRLQVRLALGRREIVGEPKSHRYELTEQSLAGHLGLLPFRLTEAQRRSLDEILHDLGMEFPMMRLLHGDVGSGKTAVAAMAMAVAAESGVQSVLMAPTELLAEQHYRSLGKILGRRYRLLLLTGSSDDAARRRQALAEGEVAIAVGTHALIQRNVGFRNLGLVIVDEQHRFGVVQRRELQLKGSRPDLLVMSATPIPRSLTLTLYGDLSVSKIDELPPGRSPVRTRVVPAANREEVYGWLEKELEAGAQAYIVLPLVEESEAVSAESIEGLGRRLADRLARFQPSVLHGRSSAEDRARIMRDFAAGRSRVLLATTLIEVGVDVPRASVMIIESAQRFGLSQLHQLRGRVGRGQAVATCVAVFAGETDEGASRLAVFARTTDGFEIAEADLALRGPGELLGTRQSGLAATGIINLVRDQEWIERARRDANELVQTDTEYSRRLASETAAVAAYDSLAGG